jgi:hypothetical protein
MKSMMPNGITGLERVKTATTDLAMQSLLGQFNSSYVAAVTFQHS